MGRSGMVMENSISGSAEHPAPEILAAFLDKQLSDEENAEVRRHLAQCEECCQVFADAVDFLEQETGEVKAGVDVPVAAAVRADVALPQEAKLLPFAESPERQLPPPAPRRLPWRGRWAAAAAAILAAVGLGAFTASQMQVSTEGLALNFQTYRSGGEEPAVLLEERDFQLGADTLNLRVAVDNGGDLLTALRRIRGSLGEDSPAVLTTAFGGKQEPSPESQLAIARAVLEADPRNLAIDRAWFDLGSWVQANRLAVRAKNRSYQQSWRNRIVLTKLLSWDASAFDKERVQSLQAARPLLREGALTEDELNELSPSAFQEGEELIPNL